MKNIFKFCLFLALTSFSFEVFSQFTYAGGGISYQNVMFDDGTQADDFPGSYSRINNGILNLDILHRPIRYVGFGLSTRLPIIKGYRYAYDFSNNSGSSFDDYVSGGGIFDEDESSTLAEGDFSHLIELRSSFTFYSRFFFTTESNIFFDIRFTRESYEEVYSYSRQGSSLPNYRSSKINKEAVSGAGIGFGYMPVITDHLYYKYQFSMDFLRGGQREVLDNIATNGGTFIVNSKIESTVLVYEITFGIGYAF